MHGRHMRASAVVFSAFLLAWSSASSLAQTTQPAGNAVSVDPWPRRAAVQGAKVEIYQPQLESRNGNLLRGFAAVTVKTRGAEATSYGVIWFKARTEVDKG